MIEVEEDMKMRDATCLKFQNPEITDIAETLTDVGKEQIQMSFYGSPVWVAVVVGRAELTYQLFGGVASNEP